MRISLLKKRENFHDVFATSVALFLQEQFEWHGKLEFGYSNGTQFTSNSFLNVIYSSTIKRNKLSVLTSEFLYHRKFLRRIAQTLYTYLSVRKPFEYFLSIPSIVISDLPEDCSNWVFIPGNHSIRVIDVAQDRCFVFVKTGFNLEFLKADAKVRMQYKWLPSPSVLEQGNSWYEEQRVIGLPWNRLSSLASRTKVLEKANRALARLYKESSHSVSVQQYNHEITNSILGLLDSTLLKLPSHDQSNIRQFVKSMQRLLQRYDSKTVQMAMTHGDFQPGNLLCADNDFWIIDWEYSASRSIFYDAAVFNLEARFTKELTPRFLDLFDKLKNGEVYYEWTGHILCWDNKYYLPIFLLEDLLVRLKEVAVKPIYAKSELLTDYLSEFLKIQTSLSQVFHKNHV